MKSLRETPPAANEHHFRLRSRIDAFGSAVVVATIIAIVIVVGIMLVRESAKPKSLLPPRPIVPAGFVEFAAVRQ